MEDSYLNSSIISLYKYRTETDPSSTTKMAIIIISIVITIVSGILIALFVPNAYVPSMIPLTLTAVCVIPQIILTLCGYKDSFDIWSGVCYCALISLVITPIILLTLNTSGFDDRLPTDFELIMRKIAWSCLLVIPLMYIGYKYALRRSLSKTRQYFREVDVSKLKLIALLLIIVGGICRILFYTVFEGGIEIGHLPEYAQRLLGTILILADGSSIGVLLLFYIWAIGHHLQQNKPGSVVGLILFILILAIVVLSDLQRGGRLYLVIFSAWAVCLFSQFVRRVPLWILLVFAFPILSVMTLYKTAKYYDYQDFGKMVINSQVRQQAKASIGMSNIKTLIGDFGRYPVWMLYAWELRPGGNIDYQYGKTYLSAVAIVIPRWILREKPAGMAELSTDVLYGRGIWKYWFTMYKRSAVIGGIWAEGYANFWYFGVWLSALVFGYFIGRIKGFFQTLPLTGIWHFLYAVAFGFSYGIIISDTRLLIWQGARLLVLLVPLFVFASRKVSLLENY